MIRIQVQTRIIREITDRKNNYRQDNYRHYIQGNQKSFRIKKGIYQETIRVRNVCSKNDIKEYEIIKRIGNNGDRNIKLSITEYLDKIKSYLKDIRNSLKKI